MRKDTPPAYRVLITKGLLSLHEWSATVSVSERRAAGRKAKLRDEAQVTLRAPDTARRTPGIPSRRQLGLIIALGALGGALRGRLGGLVARAGLAEHVDNHEITDHRGGGVAERP